MDSADTELKNQILGAVDDMVVDFVYYDRKNDEDLPVGSVERAISSGLITVEDLVSRFRTALLQVL